MDSLLLVTHSVVRYFVLIALLAVIGRSFMGWTGKKEYAAMDGKLGLWLMIATHTQFLIGLILYFTSPRVIFSAESMKDSTDRYWLVEHISMMIIAVALITVARVTSRKMTEAMAKHKRMFLFNTIALIVILTAIGLSDRGFFSLGSISSR